MKTPILFAAGLIFAGAAPSAFSAVPLTEKIGTVPLEAFRVMTGNFTKANGYTGDLTLLSTTGSLKTPSISQRLEPASGPSGPSEAQKRAELNVRAAHDRLEEARAASAAQPDDVDARLKLLRAAALMRKAELDEKHEKTLFEESFLVPVPGQPLLLTPSPTSPSAADSSAPAH